LAVDRAQIKKIIFFPGGMQLFALFLRHGNINKPEEVQPKMKLIRLIIIVLLTASVLLIADVKVNNPDKPAKGEWDFKLQKVWATDSAGDEVFAEIRQLGVSDSGRVYLHDRKNKKYYIFSPGGEFLKAFGKKGEGPGEVKWIEQARFFLVGDEMLIADSNSIHYFSAVGDFIRSVRNSYFQRRPSLFISKAEFLSAPLLMVDTRGKEAAVRLYNLESGKEKLITRFNAFKGGVARSGGMVIAMVVGGLTPMMILGYDDGRLYYGKNDSYRIAVSDLEGKAITTFGIQRKAKTISDDMKRKRFSGRGSRTPKEMLEKIIKSLPDQLTFFDRIEVHNGLIYVDPEESNNRKIDIFSREGKYLYRAVIKVDDGYSITAGPVIKNNHMYLTREDEEGVISLAKYKDSLPTT
jgi:hypothetical protein